MMVKVAQLYYDSGLKQEKIAKELGISRSSISMILTEAKEFGIVEINVKNPMENNEELSKAFEERFGIERCIIIPTTITDLKLLTKIVAERAASIVDKEMKSNSTIGIAWGTTCYEFMSSFNKNKELNNVNIVPLLGGTNMVRREYQLNEMVRMFAEKVNGIPTFIHALGIPDTLEDKNLYMQSTEMQSISEKWKNIDLAVISSGAPPEYYEKNISRDEIELFKNDLDRPVGDICARRFNIEGDFIDSEYNEKVIGIPIEDLRSSKTVICVAAGMHKVLSVLGALKTDLIDVFITDEQTAKSVIGIYDKEKLSK